MLEQIAAFNWTEIGVAVLGIMAAARIVAGIIPGKKDDEIVSVVDGIVRKVIDVLAGISGKPSDPGLIKRE